MPFPQQSCQKNTDFAQEKRLGLPYSTMIWAICVVVDESKCLDIPIWEFSVICEHPPFYLGKSRYCVSCLSCATRQSGSGIHDFCCCHFRCWWSLLGEYWIKPWIVFYNITSEYNSTFVWLVLCSQNSIFQMTYVHQWGEVNFCALRPCFIDHLFLTSDFRQVPRRIFLQIFPFLIHCCLCCRNFHGLEHRIILWTKF